MAAAFDIAERVGIDDPICWMNNTHHTVLDAWIAYRMFVNDREREAMERAKGKQSINLEDAGQALNNMVGQ